MRSRVVMMLVLLCLIQAALAAFLLLRQPSRPAPVGAGGGTTAPPSQGPGQAAPALPAGQGYVLEGSVLTLTTPDGTPEWRLEMDSIQVLQGQDRARVDGVRAERMEAGRAVLRVRAGWATLDWGSHSIQFGGGVSAESAAQDPGRAMFVADSCTYDATARKITALGKQGTEGEQANVEYRRGGVVLRGRRLVADVELARVAVEGRASMTATVSAKPAGRVPTGR